MGESYLSTCFLFPKPWAIDSICARFTIISDLISGSVVLPNLLEIVNAYIWNCSCLVSQFFTMFPKSTFLPLIGRCMCDNLVLRTFSLCSLISNKLVRTEIYLKKPGCSSLDFNKFSLVLLVGEKINNDSNCSSRRVFLIASATVNPFLFF